MGKVADAINDLFPGLPDVEMYGDDYPAPLAGHVESEPFSDPGDIRTPHGVDAEFDGESLPERLGKHGGQEVGSEATNRRIDETVEESKHTTHRQPVTNIGATAVYGNETLPDTTPRRILLPNRNRKRAIIRNQGGTLIAVSNSGDIAITGGVPTPNAAYLPNGAGALSERVIEHRQEVWIVGAAGGIVDWVEENY